MCDNYYLLQTADETLRVDTSLRTTHWSGPSSFPLSESLTEESPVQEYFSSLQSRGLVTSPEDERSSLIPDGDMSQGQETELGHIVTTDSSTKIKSGARYVLLVSIITRISSLSQYFKDNDDSAGEVLSELQLFYVGGGCV